MMVIVKKQSRHGSKKPKSILDRIRPVGFDESEGINVNVYGRSGTGKTTFWATFPKPILAIICSGGSRPGELRSIDTPEYRKTISQVIIRNTDQIREVFEALTDGRLDFRTVVIDHASGMQDLTLKEVLKLEELPVQKSWGMATQSDYGESSLRTKEILRAFLSLPCNRVLVAQEREFNTDTEKSHLMPYVASALTPSTVGWLNPACDYIVRTFIRQRMEERKIKLPGGKIKTRMVEGKGVNYCLQVGPDAVYTTKFRVPKGTVLPDVLVDPTYDKLMELIKGGR